VAQTNTAQRAGILTIMPPPLRVVFDCPARTKSYCMPSINMRSLPGEGRRAALTKSNRMPSIDMRSSSGRRGARHLRNPTACLRSTWGRFLGEARRAALTKFYCRLRST
jgi:hypothetical protein